jgi:hypothetical protein
MSLHPGKQRQRGVRKVRPCDEIVVLPSGERYPCPNHTKNGCGKCTMHRPPRELRVPRTPEPEPEPTPAPIGPPHLAPLDGGPAWD